MASLRSYGFGSVSEKAAQRLAALRAAQAADRDELSFPPYVDDAKRIYQKFKKPGTDTVPHTTGLSRAERRELQDEIDMGRSDYSR